MFPICFRIFIKKIYKLTFEKVSVNMQNCDKAVH